MDDHFVSPRDHWKYSKYIAGRYGISEAIRYNVQILDEKREQFVENTQALIVISALALYELAEKSFSRFNKSRLES